MRAGPVCVTVLAAHGLPATGDITGDGMDDDVVGADDEAATVRGRWPV